MGELEWHLDVERDAMDDFQVEVVDKGKQQRASQAREADLVAQVESLRKQMDLLKSQSAKMEVCALKAEERVERAEEEAARLKKEMPMRLEENGAKAVENFKKSEAFDMLPSRVALLS